MEVIQKINRLKSLCKKIKSTDKTIGFVPTMGALHEGHLNLVDIAKNIADVVVVSIFVNPIQFGPNEDFDKYPRNLSKDVELLTKRGVDYVFTPDLNEFYSEDFQTFVEVKEITNYLCGASRPGHFRGVTTVVAKLFSILKPDFAIFGQKDGQQAVVIKKMVKDLLFPLKIVVAPIVREYDGLAMSSRNTYLSKEERELAKALYKSLVLASKKVLQGEKSSNKVLEEMKNFLNEKNIKIDYVEIVDKKTLKPVEELKGEIMIAGAIFVGNTRLIDNISLHVS